MTEETDLKFWILVQDLGGGLFQTAGILLYIEDLEQASNDELGPKD